MLNSISFRPEYKNKHIESTDFISYDSNNQYRTSYRDMSIKVNYYKLHIYSYLRLLILILYQVTEVLHQV